MREKLTIGEMQLLAESRGGKCISEEYIDGKTKLEWSCGQHSWWATPFHVKQGTWCPECYQINRQFYPREKRTIEDMRLLAESRGGKCLSQEYELGTKKLLWECSICKNKWWTSANTVCQGSWCPACAIKRTAQLNIDKKRTKFTIKYGIGKAIEIARKRGGRCLSVEYVPTRLLWECSKLHTWFAAMSSVVKGTWCPTCSSEYNDSLGERISGVYLNNLFQNKFIKARPDWLMGLRGRSLELDWYCEDLLIACEYNGIQHYQYKSIFYKNGDELEYRIKTDDIKCVKCKENNVFLIVISYSVPLDEIGNYIVNECHKVGIKIPNADFANENYLNFDVYKKSDDTDVLRVIAEQRGGKLLSECYVNAKTDLWWWCGECGKEWLASPNRIKRGGWCPVCRKKQLSLDKMCEFAISQGGECLSIEYANVKTNMEWRCCACGDVWWDKPVHIMKRKEFCPTCAKQHRAGVKPVSDTIGLV
jgi:hypothetical protein